MTIDRVSNLKEKSLSLPFWSVSNIIFLRSSYEYKIPNKTEFVYTQRC